MTHRSTHTILLAAVAAMTAMAVTGAAAQVKERTLKFAFQNQTGHPQPRAHRSSPTS